MSEFAESLVGSLVDSMTIGDPNWDKFPDWWCKKKRAAAIKHIIGQAEDFIEMEIDDGDEEIKAENPEYLQPGTDAYQEAFEDEKGERELNRLRNK